MFVTVYLPLRWFFLGCLFMVSGLFAAVYAAGSVSELRARHNEKAFDLRMEQQRFRHRFQSDSLPLAKQRRLNQSLQQQEIRQKDLHRRHILEQNPLLQQQDWQADPIHRELRELKQRFRREYQEQQFQFKREQE